MTPVRSLDVDWNVLAASASDLSTCDIDESICAIAFSSASRRAEASFIRSAASIEDMVAVSKARHLMTKRYRSMARRFCHGRAVAMLSQRSQDITWQKNMCERRLVPASSWALASRL